MLSCHHTELGVGDWTIHFDLPTEKDRIGPVSCDGGVRRTVQHFDTFQILFDSLLALSFLVCAKGKTKDSSNDDKPGHHEECT